MSYFTYLLFFFLHVEFFASVKLENVTRTYIQKVANGGIPILGEISIYREIKADVPMFVICLALL